MPALPARSTNPTRIVLRLGEPPPVLRQLPADLALVQPTHPRDFVVRAFHRVLAEELATVDVEAVPDDGEQLPWRDEVASLLVRLTIGGAPRGLTPVGLATRDVVLAAVVGEALREEATSPSHEAPRMRRPGVAMAVVAIDRLDSLRAGALRLRDFLRQGATRPRAEVGVLLVHHGLHLVERRAAVDAPIPLGVKAEAVLHGPSHEAVAHLALHGIEANLRRGGAVRRRSLHAPSCRQRGAGRRELLPRARHDRRGHEGRHASGESHGCCEASYEEGGFLAQAARFRHAARSVGMRRHVDGHNGSLGGAHVILVRDNPEGLA
mmetsp:Transcript_1578/g.4275  ORF Transcript_1578/g.4275 Transcript_1578/m.4275 type:complete len:322 (+) Transcript_1578:609-1574(+)